ncbi:hypothetical protein ACT3TH_11960 [Psychrobacter sp. AOP22-C1-C5]|uniref:hypothetical protein n=1 Tax=Psychrobacter sp. AOP22-C1-C5 TaxID=3457716 RepID=UPI004036CB93
MINKRPSNSSRTISPLLIATCASIVSTLTTAQIPTLPQMPIPADIAQAINNVMTVSYGSDYDKLRGCTLYHKQEVFDNKGSDYIFKDSYCIAPIKYQVEEVNGETRLYLLASGYVYDGKSGNAYPGIGGLFELYKIGIGNAWVMSSSDPFIYTGGSGRSQLYDFDLSQVGDDKYAWTGKHCGGKGGQSGCLWTMYASIDSKVKPVAEIDLDYHNEIARKSIYHEGEGHVSHELYKPMTGGFYPLTVTIENTSVNYRNGKEIAPRTKDIRTYEYRPSKQQFELVK